MENMKKALPKARTTDIVVQDLGKEILLYDLITHKAFNLNETSSVVYQACNGRTSFEELKSKYKFTDDSIYLALDDFRKNNLIEDGDFVSPFAGMSRREAIRKVGLASMTALPVISSLAAPTAAMAQSNRGVVASGGGVNASTDVNPTTVDRTSCLRNLRTQCQSGRLISTSTACDPSTNSCFGCSGTCA